MPLSRAIGTETVVAMTKTATAIKDLETPDLAAQLARTFDLPSRMEGSVVLRRKRYKRDESMFASATPNVHFDCLVAHRRVVSADRRDEPCGGSVAGGEVSSCSRAGWRVTRLSSQGSSPLLGDGNIKDKEVRIRCIWNEPDLGVTGGGRSLRARTLARGSRTLAGPGQRPASVPSTGKWHQEIGIVVREPARHLPAAHKPACSGPGSRGRCLG
jgi:hypothetical protein